AGDRPTAHAEQAPKPQGKYEGALTEETDDRLAEVNVRRSRGCASVHLQLGRRAAQKGQDHEGITDADEAEEVESEGPAMALCQPAAESAQCGAHDHAAEMDARRERSGGAAMVIRDQRQRRGDITRLAQA